MQFDYDIFISYRHKQTKQEVRELAEYIEVERDNHFRIWWDRGGKEPLDGKVDEETIHRLKRSRIVVVVIGGFGITKTTPGTTGQQDEIHALIHDQELQAKQENGEMTYLPLFLLPKKEGSPDEWVTEDEIRKKCLYSNHLATNRKYEAFRVGEKENWQRTFHAVVHNWCESFFKTRGHQTIAERNAELNAAPAFDGDANLRDPLSALKSEPDSTADVSVLPWEFDYITENLYYWQRGLVSNKTNYISPTGGLLRYRPSCFVEPFAKIVGQSSDTNDQREGRPVFNWLLDNSQEFILVTGSAGAGKSTLLCQTAVAYSSTVHERFHDEVVGLNNSSEWLTSRAKETSDLEIGRIPVLLDARDLSVEIGPSSKIKAVDKLLDWIAGPEHLNMNSGGQALQQRMLERPYALIIDGLSGAESPERAQSIIEAAQLLLRRVQTRGGNLKVITSARLNDRYDDANLRRLMLMSFAVPQIEEFTQRFVASAQSNNPDRLLRRLKTQFDRTDNMIDLFGSPLFLSAACQLVYEGGALKRQRSKVEFCEAMVNHLVRPKRTRQEKEELLGTGAQIPYDDRVKFLEHLAFESINTDAPATNKSFERIINSVLAQEMDKDHFLRHEAISPRDILEDLAYKTGILEISSISSRPRFVHTLFKEYLAARYLAANIVDSSDTILNYISIERSDRWGSVVALVPDIIDTILKRPDAGFQFIEPLLTKVEEEIQLNAISSAKQHASLLFGALGADGADCETYDPEDVSELQSRTGEIFQKLGPHFDVLDRLDYRSQLARFFASAQYAEDAFPMLESHLSSILNDDLCNRKANIDSEADQLGKITQVAAAPVMVAQYRMFLEDPERENKDWKGSAWLSALRGKSSKLIDDDHTPPKASILSPSEKWSAQLQQPSIPVTHVTFFETVAFCLWLTYKSHQNGSLKDDEFYRLPTLKEWQDIASDGNEEVPKYSWGNDYVDSTTRIFPSEESLSLNSAWPVGLFEPSTSLRLFSFGTNVASWLTRAEWGWPAHPKGRAGQVVGGSWMDETKSVFEISSAKSIRQQAFAKRLPRTGFRVVVATKK